MRQADNQGGKGRIGEMEDNWGKEVNEEGMGGDGRGRGVRRMRGERLQLREEGDGGQVWKDCSSSKSC